MALPSNISVAMVKAELGASTNDVGQLCIHPNINGGKWKPVRVLCMEGLRMGSTTACQCNFEEDSLQLRLGIIKTKEVVQ